MLKKAIKLIWDLTQPDKLNQVIFFVTSRCNSRCKHCFYWKNLNQEGDLSLEEIRKISASLPRFSDLLVSGGEPFLRDDLVEVVKVFRENNKIKSVNIPTNALLKERILSATLALTKIDPELAVYINISIDGPRKIHDYIRGIPGNFDKAIEVLKALHAMSKKRENLFVTVQTVVNFYNMDDLETLMDYINDLDVPGILHNFEILRGAPKETVFAKKISDEKYEEIYSKIIKYQKKRFDDFYKGQILEFLKSKLALAHLKSFYRIQSSNYLKGKKWPMNCVAGRNIIAMDYNGNLRACELRGKVANARELNYDLSNWREILRPERKKIKKEHCSCTHCSFLYQSMHYSPKVVFFRLLPSFIKTLFR